MELFFNLPQVVHRVTNGLEQVVWQLAWSCLTSQSAQKKGDWTVT